MLRTAPDFAAMLRDDIRAHGSLRRLALVLSGGGVESTSFRTMRRKLNEYQAGAALPSDERASEIARLLNLPEDRYAEALLVARTQRKLEAAEEEARQLREVLAPYGGGPPPPRSDH